MLWSRFFFSLSFTQRLYMKQSKFVRRINREKIKILNYLADGVFPFLLLSALFPISKNIRLTNFYVM